MIPTSPNSNQFQILLNKFKPESKPNPNLESNPNHEIANPKAFGFVASLGLTGRPGEVIDLGTDVTETDGHGINVFISKVDQFINGQGLDPNAGNDQRHLHALPPQPKGSIYWSKRQTCMVYFAVCLFTSIVIIVGVVAVYFGSRKEINTTCNLTFKRAIGSSVGYNSEPTNIATGDFNGDHQIDLATANLGSDNIGIFLGNGDGTFASQITYSTGKGSRPSSIAVGNFNNDNKQDIAVANYGINSVGILLGRGNGSFASQIIVSLGSSHPISLAIGNFNNDNYTDIVVASNSTLNVAILLGNNDGSFRLQVIYYMGFDSIPNSIALADLNNDKYLDIVTVNYGTSNLVILMGNGSGIFARYNYSTGSRAYPSSVVVGYFNNDSIPDIAVANSGTSNAGIFLGYGNGTFKNLITYSTGSDSEPKFIGVGDFNKDNRTDIVIVNSETNDLIVLQQSGNGTFSQVIQHPIGNGSNPCSIAVGDFDNDNLTDVAVTNPGTNNILLLTQYTVYPTANLLTYPTGTGSYPYFISIADFNNDKLQDVAVVNRDGRSIGIFMGQGNGIFGKQQTYYTGDNSIPLSLAIGDVNNDKLLDIVVVATNTSTLSIFLGNGNGTFRYGNIYSTGVGSIPVVVALADFNKDKYLDIVVGDAHSNNALIFHGYGNGTFANTATYPIASGSSYIQISINDMNNDNVSDIIVANYGSASVCILLGYSNGSFQNIIFVSLSPYQPTGIAVADLNNDNRLDVVFTAADSYLMGILYGDGQGYFTNIARYSTDTGSYPWSVMIVDFNNDGLLDIALGNVWISTVSIFLGYRNQNFAMSNSLSTGTLAYPISIALTDLNNDKQLDIVVANLVTVNVAVLLVYNVADFLNNQTYSTGTGPHPSSVVYGNFNNDSGLEIVVANSGNDNIQILFNYDKGTSMSKFTYPLNSGSNPQNVAVGDFNKDGKLDIVVSNLLDDNIDIFLGNGNGTFGIKSEYSTGYASYPGSIAVGDFNKDKRIDIVVTNAGTNNVAVFLGFEYPSFTDEIIHVPGTTPSPVYVVAADFNNDGLCDIAVANQQADNVGVYFGYGNGSFSEQISVSTGPKSGPSYVIAADMNHDNKLDLIVARYSTNSARNFINIFTSFGNESSPDISIEIDVDATFFPRSMAIGDFNSDNNLDIVVVNDHTGDIHIFLGTVDGTISSMILLVTGASSKPYSAAVNDLNHDNHLDIVVGNAGAQTIGIFLGYGNGSFSTQISFSPGNSFIPRFVAVGDFNKDNNQDIAAVGEAGHYVGIFLGNGKGTFSAMITFPVGSASFLASILVVDLNNDTALDIVVTDWADGNNNVGVLYGHGDGTFAVVKTYLTGLRTNPSSTAICDFNNDGRLDMVASNYFADSLDIFLRDSTEPFATPLLFSTGDGSYPQSVAVADFNNDDKLDIAVANYGTNNIGIFLGYGNGQFANQQNYSTGIDSGPVSLSVGDINHDNYSDIVVANSVLNNIVILLGYGNGTLAIATNYSTGTSSNPSSVVVIDIDNDNYLDIVVANLGISSVLVFRGRANGTFLAPESYSVGFGGSPTSICVGDINNDNLLDIVVANYGTDYVELLLQTC